MTADEAAEFIALWTEGLSLKDIGARLGIPPGTVSSRAAALRRQGVALDKRPQGGAYPWRKALARQGTVHGSVQSSAGHGGMHGADAVHNRAVHAPVHGAV